MTGLARAADAQQAASGKMPWAVVTPSYNLDFQRCQLLCRSMDAFLSGPWHHYIIVDPVDLKLFASLAGPRRTIINKADILPKGMRYVGKIPFLRLGRLWWSRRHGFILGWQMQQIVKISMASFLTQDALLFCDSDTLFLKPFEISNLDRHEAVRFGSIEVSEAFQHKLVSNSVAMLQLEPRETTRFCIPDALMVWHRKIALALQDYLSKLHHKPWHEVIGSRLMFSEYQLYNLFVDYILKNCPLIYRDNTIFCKTLWNKREAAETSIADFCNTLEPHQVAICIQSRIGIDTASIEHQFELALASYARRKDTAPSKIGHQ